MRHLSRSHRDAIAAPLTSRSASFTEDGLVMGHGSCLIRAAKDANDRPRLGLKADRDRCAALMSIVGGRLVKFDALRHVEAAEAFWCRGDTALANLRLIFADLPGCATPRDADRLALAEHLLDNGMPPAELLKELGFDLGADDLAKYSPDQPRVPAGHGRESGQFGSGGGSVAFAPPAAAAPTLLEGASPSALESFAVFASRFSGPVAFLTAMIIPTPNSGGVYDGTLPDMPDVAFHKDGPAGKLLLTTKAPDGSDVVVVARSQHNLFVDVRTGQAIGRDLGASLYLDAPSVRHAIDTQVATLGQEEPERNRQAATDEPQLCPAPEEDKKNERGRDYEDDVHKRVNPEFPTPPGMAIRVTDPVTGRSVYFDDCFRTHGDLVDGDMKPGDLVEAKGPGYESLLSQKFGESPMQKLIDQAKRQRSAAFGRGAGLKWYFAEKGAADVVRERFSQQPALRSIVIRHMPPRKGR